MSIVFVVLIENINIYIWGLKKAIFKGYSNFKFSKVYKI